MKNLPLVLSSAALVAVAILYGLHFSAKNAPDAPPVIAPPPSSPGARIAYVNGDSLDARYERLKEFKATMEKKMDAAEKSLASKQEALMRDMAGLQERFAGGNMTQADAEKEQTALLQRRDRLAEEAEKMDKQLAEEQKKGVEAIYVDLEAKLRTLSDQIGYDYILSYSRGAQVLFAKDSLDITNQVLGLLNAEEKK